MALSIGVSAGSQIDVGGHNVSIRSIVKSLLIVLTVDDGPDLLISDQARTEILPNVFVFAGMSPTGGGSRLAFEAPKEVRISRIPHSVQEEMHEAEC